MTYAPARRVIRGNVKPLIALTLATIGTLYLLGRSSETASTELVETPVTVTAADNNAQAVRSTVRQPTQPRATDTAAVERALTAEAQAPVGLERLTVVAQRIHLPPMNLSSPEVQIALVATPPKVQRDPS